MGQGNLQVRRVKWGRTSDGQPSAEREVGEGLSEDGVHSDGMCRRKLSRSVRLEGGTGRGRARLVYSFGPIGDWVVPCRSISDLCASLVPFGDCV